jgi:hypothetical protein
MSDPMGKRALFSVPDDAPRPNGPATATISKDPACERRTWLGVSWFA